MTEAIISHIAGELKPDVNIEEWLVSLPVEIPYFGNLKLPVTFCCEDIERSDIALANFLLLSEMERIEISNLVFRYYEDCKNRGDSLFPTFISESNQIWDFIYPTNVYIEQRPRNDKDIYIQVACECTWEPEHGLQLIFRQGRKLTRVSEQDGHLTEADAFDMPDSEDELLSKF